MSLGIFHFTGSASRTSVINVSSVSILSTSAAEPVLLAGAFRERWLFPDTMIASLAASPIIVVLQQDCVLQFLIKIRAALWKRSMQPCQHYESNARESGKVTDCFCIEIWGRFSKHLCLRDSCSCWFRQRYHNSTEYLHLIETNTIFIEETTQCITVHIFDLWSNH